MSGIGPIGAGWHESWRRTVLHWERAQDAWRDEVRERFQRTYWEPLERETRATQHEMKRLEQVIAQAERSLAR